MISQNTFEEVSGIWTVFTEGKFLRLSGNLPVQKLPEDVILNPENFIDPYPSFYKVCFISFNNTKKSEKVEITFYSKSWYPGCFIDFSFDKENPKETCKLTGNGIPEDLQVNFYRMNDGYKCFIFKSEQEKLFNAVINFK